MPWTERQREMLQAMGLRTWQMPEQIIVPRDFAPRGAPAAQPAPPPASPAVQEPSPLHRRESPAGLPDGPRAAAQADAAMAASVATPADRAAIANMDWPALRTSVAGCTACGLCETRRQTVFGVGSPTAHWLVVGEAPGEQEDLQGEPFVGPAGQLLDRMLAALGLTRSADGAAGDERRAMIVNTLKCRPPRNRNPQPEEMAACAPYLTRQIDLLQPRVILALGRFAVQALLGSDEPIGRMRGRIHRASAFGGRPVVVSYHPSYLLRQPAEKAKAWEDLCLAASVADAVR